MSPLVAALRAPIDHLRATIDGGVGADATTVLGDTLNTVAHIGSVSRQAWACVAGVWSGMAAEQAGQFAAETARLVEELVARATDLLATASEADTALERARRELEAIADEFTDCAEPLATRLDEPGSGDALARLAHQAVQEARAVMDRLSAALDGHTAAITTPAGVTTGSWAAPVSPVSSSWSPEPQAANSATGVAVTLPDGSTVTAPNALAASAVRRALTQLGVPYDWGGTTPGVGLDCSGLTQWAYAEAGLGLPRLAQEQDVGAAVNSSAVMPGDLAVWDGHVAMIVGDGLMIEAGDPVQLSQIRTTNSGQGFQGFWRPTA